MNINKIPTKLVYGDTHDSNRGPYRMVENFREFYFTKGFLFEMFEIPDSPHYLKNAERFKKLVQKEFDLFSWLADDDSNIPYDELRKHPFWAGEESYLLDSYINLHKNFQRKMAKSRYSSSRNTVSAEADTCVSYFQRHSITLYCVSRSCDISLGFYADLYTCYLYMKKYDLWELKWYITVPHVYCNNIELTNQQFELNEKINKGMIFNMRKKFND